MPGESEENPRGAATQMSPARLLRILLSHVRPYAPRAALLVLTLLVEGVFNVLLALSLKFIIDFAITPRRASVLTLVLAGLAAGFLLTAASQVLRDYLYAWLGSRVVADIRAEMFRHLQRLSPGFYARARMGDLSARFSSDLNAVENAVVLGIPGALLCAINIIFSACVLFDGVDLRDARLDSLYDRTGVVFQESFLFDTSVRENIRAGREGATDAEVEEAARAAEIHDVIARMPDGYDTTAGERGGLLSGGQRRRVAIARALVRNPSLIILDEATSALDPESEAAINETMGRVSVGRTVISVTHRQTSVVSYDHIFVFHEGGLIERGTHEELLRLGGTYSGMWRSERVARMRIEG